MQKKITQKSNAERFIMAYNKIDYSLRSIYGFKRSISFADLIRKAVTMNSVVRKYEDEIIDYGRLRNSIVHKTNPNYVIAEPHDEVVDEFEKIAKLISTPPTAYDRVCRNDVFTCDGGFTIKQVLEFMAKTGFHNIPIYINNELQGVAVGSKILTKIGQSFIKGENVDNYLKNTRIIELVSKEDESNYFRVADKNLTIEKALNYFYLNRKLMIIIITEKGSFRELPIGVITVADILDMNAVLENY